MRWLWVVLIVLAFLLGLGVRLYDLKDAPLDFHPTRQLHSALIARGIYFQNLPDAPEWQRQMSMQQWQAEGLIEPQIMERLAAWSYQLLGSEQLWAARAWAILFWMIGALFLCLLARDLFGLAGAAMAVIYFLLWPYAVISSRAFQPEALQVCMILAGLWAAARWMNAPSHRRAVLAGILCGLAIYVKSVAVFFIAPALAGLLLTNFSPRELLRNRQVWLMFTLAVSPYILYHIYGVYMLGLLGEQFSLRFFPNLWLDPVFYLQWINELKGAVGLELFLAALAALLVLPGKRWQGLLGGLLLGYALYGFTFAYHISTHDYYQMPLLAITALGLAALFDLIVRALPRRHWSACGALALVLVAFMLLKTWDARVTLKKNDYRNEVRFWEKLGERLGHDSLVTGLMSDYGYRLAYWGWVDVRPWMQISDIRVRELSGQQVDVPSALQSALAGRDYFVVTLMDEFERQPELKTYLDAAFSLVEDSDEVLIYDLRAEAGTEQ